MPLIPTVSAPPAVQPVTLEAVKNFARITTTTDDDLINGFIATATEQAELYTGRMFITRTLLYRLNQFPYQRSREGWWDGVQQGAIGELMGRVEPIALPCVPLQAVTSIITYDQYDASTLIDPSLYRVDANGGRIILSEGNVWPVGLRNEDAVEITVTAGYGDTAANIPQSICTAIMMQAQIMYDSRAACGLCDGSKTLLQPFRIIRI